MQAHSGYPFAALAVACALVAGIALTPAVAVAADSPPEKAGEVVTRLAGEAIGLLRTSDMMAAERERRFREIFEERFAVDSISRFITGRYWRQMTPAQRARFHELFTAWVVKVYAIRLSNYSGERLDVIDTVPANGEEAMVNTMIVKPGKQQPVKVGWRLRPVDGRFRIVDVVVEGVSMAVAQRSEFSSILDRDGVDGLLERLERSLAKLRDGDGT